MQLLKNDTVKQHENNHSGSCGDAEQEFADFFFYDLKKKIYVYQHQVSQAKTWPKQFTKTFLKTIASVLLKV